MNGVGVLIVVVVTAIMSGSVGFYWGSMTLVHKKPLVFTDQSQMDVLDEMLEA